MSKLTIMDKYYSELNKKTDKSLTKNTATPAKTNSFYSTWAKKQNTIPFMPDDWKKDLNKYLKESKSAPNRNKGFEKILKMTQKNLKNYVKIRLENMGYDVRFEDGFVYGKGEIPVLLVAHLDTVHVQVPYQIIYKDDYMFSPQGIGGDDRCGVYMILKIVQELKCHVLFTEDEEIGCIGANMFSRTNYPRCLKGKLNYIIEFDRRNAKDCVFYDCDNPEFENFIIKASDKYFKTAWGSCSDISTIAPAIGVAAVNLSCGYYQEHTLEHYINLKEMETTIEKAKQIIQTPCEEPFEYMSAWHGFNSSQYFGYSYYDDCWDYGHGAYIKNYTNNKTTNDGYNVYGYKSDDYYEREDYNVTEVEIENPNKTIAGSRYHIVFELPYEMMERVAEIIANNEDEAVGLLMKHYPDICYGDIIEIRG